MTIDGPAPSMGSEEEEKGPHTTQAWVDKGREEHRWCYVSEQMPEEVLVVGLWDSDNEGGSVRATGMMHSSMAIEGRDGEELIMSLKVRLIGSASGIIHVSRCQSDAE